MNRHDDKTVKDTAPRRPPTGRAGNARWGAIWTGELLADTYQVMEGPIGGSSMGRIYRVHHTGWDMDLAMKQPDPRLFVDDEEKERFIENECALWIEIGYHPSIVTCYYVRDIGGMPSIFSEWMKGGNLKHLIGGGNGPLYSGPSPLSRILEIAVQTARGLQYAQEKRGIVHRDVKPSNILLDEKGRAKVADFGLALGNSSSLSPREARMGTKEYSSPEQMDGRELTGQTDIYSFGVTLLEMFLGARRWDLGPVAGYALEEYLRLPMKVPMPQAVQTLLRECLREAPDDRFRSFDLIATVLREVFKEQGCVASDPDFWQDTAGNAVPPQETADSLNNRALSYLDIGKAGKAMECWDEALQLNGNHVETIYNRALHLWRRGSITDLVAIQRVGVAAVAYPYKAHWLTAHLHLERGDPAAALESLQLADRAANAPRVPQSEYDLVHSLYPKTPASYALPTRFKYLDLQPLEYDNRVLCIAQTPNFLPIKRKVEQLLAMYDLDTGDSVHVDGKVQKAAHSNKLRQLGAFVRGLLTRFVHLWNKSWQWEIWPSLGPLFIGFSKEWSVCQLSDDGNSLWMLQWKLLKRTQLGRTVLKKRRIEDFACLNRISLLPPHQWYDLNIRINEAEDVAAVLYTSYTREDPHLFELYSFSNSQLLGRLEFPSEETGRMQFLPDLRHCLVSNKNCDTETVFDIATGAKLWSFQHDGRWDLKPENIGETHFSIFRRDLAKTPSGRVPVELWNHHTGRLSHTIYLDDLNEHDRGIVLPGDRYFLYVAGKWTQWIRLYDLQEKRVIRSFCSPWYRSAWNEPTITKPVYRHRFCIIFKHGYAGPGMIYDIPDFPYRAAWQLCTIDPTDARAKAEREYLVTLQKAEALLANGQKAEAYLTLQKPTGTKGFFRSVQWAKLYNQATEGARKTGISWCHIQRAYPSTDGMLNFALSADETFAIISCRVKKELEGEAGRFYLRVIDLETGDTFLQLETGDMAFALSPDDNWLAYNHQKSPCFFNLHTGEEHRVDWGEGGRKYDHHYNTLGFTPDGRYLYANGFFFDAQSFKALDWYHPPNTQYYYDTVQFTPDGGIMALLGRYDSSFMIHQLRPVEMQYTLITRDPVFCFSPDGKRYVKMRSGNVGEPELGLVEVYSLENRNENGSCVFWGTPSVTYPIATEEVGPVTFSPDGRFIVTTIKRPTISHTGFVLIDTLEPEQAEPQVIHVDDAAFDPFAVQFSADGNFIYFACPGGFFRWELGWNYDVPSVSHPIPPY